MFITGYSELSLTRGGILQDLSSEPTWGAYFKLDNDVREIFPFINATLEKVRYQLRPLHVRFVYQRGRLHPLSGRGDGGTLARAGSCHRLYRRSDRVPERSV